MHILIVNFNLVDLSEEDYLHQAEMLAPAFAGLPGLISKTWLADPATNTYGGVYLWRDQGAMESYRASDIYKGMLSNPHFENVSAREFAVLEDPTSVTRGTTAPRPRHAPGAAV